MNSQQERISEPRNSAIPVNGRSFLGTALSYEVMSTATKVGLVVGTLLALINHGPDFLQGTIGKNNLFQIGLTYLVPYCVSTYSAVKVIQARQQDI